MRLNSLIKMMPVTVLMLALSAGLVAKDYPNSIVGSDSSEVYNIVDEMPEIVGGLPALYKKIVYPDLAMKSGVEGRVFVRFIVDEEGKVTNPEVLKDIGAGCGEAAIKALKNMKFTQAKLNGEVVRVYYTLPITFKIAN